MNNELDRMEGHPGGCLESRTLNMYFYLLYIKSISFIIKYKIVFYNMSFCNIMRLLLLLLTLIFSFSINKQEKNPINHSSISF